MEQKTNIPTLVKEPIPTMLTINETAKRVNIPYSALRRLCIENRITHIRVGSKVLINLEKLITYLNGETE